VVHNGISIRSSSCRNHTGATDFPEQITRYLIKEASYQAVVGPSKDNPFNDPIALSPLNSVPKKDSVLCKFWLFEGWIFREHNFSFLSKS
jgi:hypothetical protein